MEMLFFIRTCQMGLRMMIQSGVTSISYSHKHISRRLREPQTSDLNSFPNTQKPMYPYSTSKSYVLMSRINKFKENPF